MSQKQYEESAFERFRSVKRKAVRLSQDELIKKSYLNPDEKFPLVIEPGVSGLNLIEWAKGNPDAIEADLLMHGAILFRNFGFETENQFEQFARSISPELLDYSERAAPRIEVGRNVYTSTEFPPDQPIPLHHEMSYSHNWPTKIWFFCKQPPLEGGRTPIASDRKILTMIAPEIRERFMQKKVMYVRNYGEGIDLPWQEVFQTSDRDVVEDYCRQSRMELEWIGSNRLRTRQVRQAVAIHPKTGEMVWFNHAHMFHTSNLDPCLSKSLLAEFAPDELPRNSFYGDGSPIESSILSEIRDIYDKAAVRFTWQKGDILMLDNFLSSHGREPFTGPRKILVTMAELYTNLNL